MIVVETGADEDNFDDDGSIVTAMEDKDGLKVAAAEDLIFVGMGDIFEKLSKETVMEDKDALDKVAEAEDLIFIETGDIVEEVSKETVMEDKDALDKVAAAEEMAFVGTEDIFDDGSKETVMEDKDTLDKVAAAETEEEKVAELLAAAVLIAPDLASTAA
jgi:hypothetical protein